MSLAIHRPLCILGVMLGLTLAGQSHAASRVDVGPTVDGGTHYPDQRANFFVGRDSDFERQDAGPRAPYYLLRGARWTTRIAFRTAPGALRVVGTRNARVTDYAVPGPCIPRDVAAHVVLLGCPSGSDIRLLHLSTGTVTAVPNAGGATTDFWGLALGRHWILGEACGGDPLLVPPGNCMYEFIRRTDGAGRISKRPLDIDTRQLKTFAAATTHPPFVAPTLSDTTRKVVLTSHREQTIHCSGSCLDIQLVGRWATWRDVHGIGVLDTKTGHHRHIEPAAGTELRDLQQRPGRKLVTVEGTPDGSDHIIVIGI